MVAGGDGGGHENGEALALALEGGDPPLGAEAHAGAQHGSVELVDLALIVLCMLNPCNLQNVKSCHHDYSVTCYITN